MGELLDSYYMKKFTFEQYEQRIKDYYLHLDQHVDIWEIGNEINGEWLGEKNLVIKKMLLAFDYFHSKNKITAITFYYNKGCYAHPEHEMFHWIKENVPNRMKQKLDYVFISYYEEDCNNQKPDWDNVFFKLGTVFPNSKLGFGEVGTSDPLKKPDYIKRYYGIQIDHPRFIGGYFWWYFYQDMVITNKEYLKVLKTTILKKSLSN